MPRLGVLGWPVAHSRSPAMHNAALGALGMTDWRYQLLPVPPERLAETVPALGPAGFLGANVTIPHKQAALALAHSATPAARAIGAANTLTFAPDRTIAAENTDAPGFLSALGVAPRGLSALVLGAGGSSRAVVWALAQAGAREVSVWNRTPERARLLARELDARFAAAPAPADILVNCTSVGLDPEPAIATAGVGEGRLTPSPALAPGSVGQSATATQGLNLPAVSFDAVGDYPHVVDLVYSSTPTPLLVAARAHGAHAVDGREVLLAQGALSFELWTGRSAPREVMRRALDQS